MSKTTAITIVLIAILLLGGGLAYWYYNLTKSQAVPSEVVKTDTGENLFPFGANIDGTPKIESETNNVTPNLITETPEVYEISAAPVSGLLTLVSTSTGPYVRFVEQETGHVYDATLQIVEKKRISNTTVPKTREIVWLPYGLGFIARYVGDNGAIQSFSATLNPALPEETEGSLLGRFLPESLTDISLVTSLFASTTAKNPAKIFYLTESANGATGFIANADGTKSAKAFSSPLNEWLSFPVTENLVFLQTKSSGYADSFVFSLNPKTNLATKILGGVVGLNILPNKKGDMILYSETSRGSPRLHLYDVAKKTTNELSLNSFAEKCVWSETESTRVICGIPTTFGREVFPDAWYQGKVSFSDDIWEINTLIGETKQLVDLNDNSFFFDIELPRLSGNDSYFLLRDKTNGSLWSVRLPR